VVTTQIILAYKVLSTVSTDMTVTSEQRLVSQDDLVVLLEIKAITLNSDNTGSLKITLLTVALNTTAVSGNYIT